MKNTIRVGIFEFNSNGDHLSMGLCKKAAPVEKKDIKIKKIDKIEAEKNQKNTQ